MLKNKVFIWYVILKGRKLNTVFSDFQNDVETVLGNCQLYIYGAHVLHLYTFVEFMIVSYCMFLLKYFQGPRGILVAVFTIAKIMFRGAVFFCVKYFMSDLNKPSCTCGQVGPDEWVVLSTFK